MQGDNNRIVSDSTDNSINLNIKNSNIKQSIGKMKELLTASDLPDSQKDEASGIIEELDDPVHAKSDNKTIKRILEKLMKFFPLASFVYTIIKSLE